jgi:hypothetical protein
MGGRTNPHSNTLTFNSITLAIMAGCHMAKASSASSPEEAYEMLMWLGYPSFAQDKCLKPLFSKSLSMNVQKPKQRDGMIPRTPPPTPPPKYIGGGMGKWKERNKPAHGEKS